ncbi:hypothetical protein D3C72_1894230 [compost metagenome]
MQGITGLERLDGSQVIVDQIAVITVGEHRQSAVGAAYDLATVDRNKGAAGKDAADTNAIVGLGVSRIDIAVIAQQVTGRGDTGSPIVGATGFDSHRAVVDGYRVVVAPMNGDGQGGGADSSSQIANGVGEGLAQGIAGPAQGLYQRI